MAGAAFALFTSRSGRAEQTSPVESPLLLTPEQEEGPFYIDAERLRHDITEGRPGIPLQLRIRLVDSTAGGPLPQAAIDIWHCDASGIYSGYAAMKNFGPPPGGHPFPGHGSMAMGGGPPPGFPSGPPPGAGGHPPHHPHATNHATFLRGVQLTDADGRAEFATIYPGWYQGRCIHIHLKVHVGGAAQGALYSGGHVCHTGQLFFPEETSAAISQMKPYANSSVIRTTQARDGVFQREKGDRSIVNLRPISSDPAAGYLATITLTVAPAASPDPVGFR